MYKFTVKVTQHKMLGFGGSKDYLVTVYTNRSDKPSESEIKDALRDKYGEVPGGMIELNYYRED